MFSFKKNIYNILPIHFKRIIGKIPYSIISGKPYRMMSEVCKKIEYASQEEIHKFQKDLLSKILDFSTSQVPAYKKYRSIFERLTPFEALKGFPLLSKETLQSNINEYIPDCIKDIPHHKAYTGGTSGNQLTFNEDDSSYAREMAFMHQQWKRVGYKPIFKKATFRGVSFKKIDNSYWQENPIHNELQFSPFHINDSTTDKYINQLIKYKPQYIHGYPSAVDIIAEYVVRENIQNKMPIIRAILLGSESCSSAQRQRIEHAFNSKVFSWYGHSERLILGGECEMDTSFHHFPGYGVVEIINDHNEQCLPGDRGELVGTTFWNKSMPLIRYRTDDSAIQEEPTCNCRRNWLRFSDVYGRWNIEGVVGKSGSKISAAALNMHGDLYKNVIRYQYFQNKIGTLEILIMPSPAYTDKDKKIILDEHKKKMWAEFEIKIRLVNDIPLTKNGKLRRIICELE